MNKKELRKEMKLKRDKIPEDIRDKYSRIAEKQLLSLPFVASSKKPCLFLSFGSEINTTGIVQCFLKRSVTVYLPRIDNHTMVMCPVRHMDGLVKSSYGILEPVTEAVPVVPDLILVPGLLFGQDGSRLGYGGGYYDRFLADKKNVIKIGYAFSMQTIKKVPMDEHDVYLDGLVTENGLQIFNPSSIIATENKDFQKEELS